MRPGGPVRLEQLGLDLFEFAAARVFGGKSGEGALDPDKRAPRVASFLQPVGIDQSGRVVVRRRGDQAVEGDRVLHIGRLYQRRRGLNASSPPLAERLV